MGIWGTDKSTHPSSFLAFTKDLFTTVRWGTPAPPVHPMDSLQATSQEQVPDFVEGEDVESFFIRFEHIARIWAWPTDEWASRVVTSLTSKPLEAYAGMDEQRAADYGDIKVAVLDKYNVTEETYRLWFRGLTVPSGETYNYIKGLYKRWMRPETKTKDQIGRPSFWNNTCGCFAQT